MARTIIDSIGVETFVETSNLLRGLDLVDAALDEFRSTNERLALAIPAPDLTQFEAGLNRARSLLQEASTPVAAPAQAFDSAPVEELINRFELLQGVEQGVQEGLAELAATTGGVLTAQEELAVRTLAVAEALRAQGVAEDQLNGQLERQSLLSVQNAQGILRSSQAAEKGFSSASASGNRLLNTITGLGVGAVGLQGKVGNLVGNLLTLSTTAAAGGVAAVAAAGGLIFLGRIVDQMTDKQNDLKEKTEEAIDRLIKQGQLRSGSQEAQVATDAATSERKAARLRELSRTAAEELERSRRAIASGLLPPEALQAAFEQAETSQNRLVALGREYLRTQQAVAGAVIATNALDRDRIQRLATLTNLSRATAADQQALARIVADAQAELASLSAGSTASEERRAELAQVIAAGLEAQADPLQRIGQLSQDVAQQQIALVQRLQQQGAGVFAPVTIRADVSNALRQLKPMTQELDRQISAAETLARRFAEVPDLADRFKRQAESLRATRDQAVALITTFGELRVGDITNDLRKTLTAAQVEAAEAGGIVVPISLDGSDALQAAEQLRNELQERVQAFQQAGAAPPPALTAALDTIQGLIKEALDLPSQQLIGAAEALSGRLEAMQSLIAETRQLAAGAAPALGFGPSIREITEAQAELGPLLDQIRLRYEAIGAALEDEKTPQSEILALMQEQARLAGVLAQNRPPTPIEITQLAPLQEAAVRYAEARQQFEAAAAQGLGAQAREAATVMEEAGKALDAQTKSVVSTVLALKLDAETTARILAAVADAYAGAGREAKQLSADTKAAIQTLNDTSRIIGAIEGIGNAFGGLDDDIQRVLSSVGQLSVSIADVAANASFGNIVGLVGAAGGLLGSLFGGDNELKRTMQENNERLQALRDEISGLTERLSSLRQAQEATQALSPTEFAGIAAVSIFDPSQAERLLNERIERFGLTLDELDRIAEAQGLDLVKENGRIVANGFEVLNQVLGLTIEDLTNFGTSLSEQQQVLETRDALGLGPNAGLPDDVAALARTREIELSNLNLDPALEAKIAGLDLTTEEGRQAFLEFNRMLFQMAENGQLTAEQLGTFESVQELLGPINDAAIGLQGFDEAVNDATSQLREFNIPRGFRREAIAFQASGFNNVVVDAGISLGGDALQPIEPPLRAIQDILADIREGAPADLLSKLDVIAAEIRNLVADRITTAPGFRTDAAAARQNIEINVTVQGTASPSTVRQDAERGVIAALRRKGLLQTGSTLQVRIR